MTSRSSNQRERVHGYDLARALAVFGMVVVNFTIVMGVEEGSTVLHRFAGLFEGRAVALFVVLAGVGLSLFVNRARESADQAAIRTKRIGLFKRAAFLIVVGFLYTPIWPADILHFYGFYFIAGALLFTVKDRTLWWIIGSFITGFLVLATVFNYEWGWDLETLTNTHFSSPLGVVSDLFFNGFHPVFPWAALLFGGMWLGRQHMTDPRTRRRIALIAGTVWLAIEALSSFMVRTVKAGATDLADGDIEALFGTSPMPPTPQYIIAGGALSFLLIALCIAFAEKFESAKWLEPLYRTGKMALTLYVLHVVLGMGVLDSLGMLGGQSIEAALISTAVFCVFGVLFSYLWLSKFSFGPLEWVFRKVTDTRDRKLHTQT